MWDHYLMQTEFNENGFAIIKSVFSTQEIDKIVNSIEAYRQSKSNKLPGLRNMLSNCVSVKEFAAGSKLTNLASRLLGSDAKPINAVLFDKTQESNWYVTWHQDLSIVVKEKREHSGFGPWTIKDGLNYVQPPASILERIVALRIHLDTCPIENGAIKFIPSSHLKGIIEPASISSFRQGKEVVECPCEKGDVIAMRPLILHASSQVSEPKNRRVLHIEYSNAVLPNGLEFMH